MRKNPRITWEEIQDVAWQTKKSRQEAEDALVLSEGNIPTAVWYLKGNLTKNTVKEIVEKRRKENLL